MVKTYRWLVLLTDVFDGYANIERFVESLSYKAESASTKIGLKN